MMHYLSHALRVQGLVEIPCVLKPGGFFRADSIYDLPWGLDRFAVEQERLAPNSDSVMAAARHKIEILGPLPE